MARRRRDIQADRLYRWQWKWSDWNRATISLDEAKKLITEACRLWDVPPPNDIRRIPKSKPFSSYNDGTRLITLLPCHMNPAMVLHEVAHHITDIRYGTGYEPHGPQYLGVFADLLVDFKVAPADAIYASLKAHGLRWAQPKTVKRKR